VSSGKERPPRRRPKRTLLSCEKRADTDQSPEGKEVEKSGPCSYSSTEKKGLAYLSEKRKMAVGRGLFSKKRDGIRPCPQEKDVSEGSPGKRAGRDFQTHRPGRKPVYLIIEEKTSGTLKRVCKGEPSQRKKKEPGVEGWEGRGADSQRFEGKKATGPARPKRGRQKGKNCANLCTVRGKKEKRFIPQKTILTAI